MEHTGLTHVQVNPVDLDRLSAVYSAEEIASIRTRVADAQAMLGGRTVWNINSTAHGGGVAEMLQPLLGYCIGFGLDVRWLVIPGDSDFFDVTKRLHNNLHASEGDGGKLGEAERRIYEKTLAPSIETLRSTIRDGDIVICHDPQPAGLIPELAKNGVTVIWRCHIGYDRAHPLVDRAWRFLEPYLGAAKAYVFSREAYIPKVVDRQRCVIIAPSIDPFSAKNQPMSKDAVRSILVKCGIVEGPNGEDPTYLRGDGTRATVERAADMMHLGRLPAMDRPLVVQVSRWDHLKDPIGVMEGFARYLSDVPASLVLAGPNVSAVADDPEGGRVLDEVESAWRSLPHEVRKSVHIACLPMEDREENAAIVNALQRHAAVIVQKSLHEGFGLTVTEGMWKGRPVVASAVGGIQDQIDDGENGLLVKDATDLEAFAGAVRMLLEHPEAADRIGERAREKVREHFLFVRHLYQYADLFNRLINGRAE